MTGSPPRVLVIHGPNLNLLGAREPQIYGTKTLAAIDAELHALASDLGVEVECHQSNHEGALLDLIHGAVRRCAGIVINPGAFAHTSVAIHDGLRAVALPAVEVHLSNIHGREPLRQRMITAAACVGVISGLGSASYLLALRYLAATRSLAAPD
jgi:3-dehydroquinate dehydratase-2